MADRKITANVDVEGLDEAIEKTNRLIALLTEVQQLIDSLRVSNKTDRKEETSMNRITVKQLLDVIGDRRVQLFDDDTNLLLADSQTGSSKIQKYNDHFVAYAYFREYDPVCLRIYKGGFK